MGQRYHTRADGVTVVSSLTFKFGALHREINSGGDRSNELYERTSYGLDPLVTNKVVFLPLTWQQKRLVFPTPTLDSVTYGRLPYPRSSMGTATDKEIGSRRNFPPCSVSGGSRAAFPSCASTLRRPFAITLSIRSIVCCAALQFVSLPAASLVSAWPLLCA